ncbi:hypothetical protein CHM34_01140 [Paludifilum halophilum]|uniref:Helix-turn-helix conjugative transposon-like domain-containing protein n=1 Tax=Paludifilum halophilum TaxID=1642702 RepID=A0A235BDG6_9BACL|nr:hypothetical protein CHM34_01140 [Paludifilum halophilum]
MLVKAKQKEPSAQQKLLTLIEPKIRYHTRYLPFHDKQDAEQEIRIKILRSLDRFEIRSVSVSETDLL